MKRPHSKDIEEAVACLKDHGHDRVALWLEYGTSKTSIRTQARNMGVTVSYYRKQILGLKL